MWNHSTEIARVMFTWLLGGWRSVGDRRTLAEMTAYDFAVAVAFNTAAGEVPEQTWAQASVL